MPGNISKIDNYVTLYPGVNLSGSCTIGSYCELGTNSSYIQGIKLGKENIVGAGACVTKNFGTDNIIVGVPGKVLIK